MTITHLHFQQNHKQFLLFSGIGCLLLLACSSTSPTRHTTPCQETNAVIPDYSLVFIIHGDGDYLWHDEYGQAHHADKDALAQASRVALNNPRAEAFIFYQKPRNRKMVFFAQPDGAFYYYRNGQLCRQQSYNRRRGPSRFSPEAALYQQIHLPAGNQVRLFIYLGHEIPLYNGLGYDASMKNRSCTLQDIGAGLKQLTQDSTRMDIAILSTCYSGTPPAVAAVAPYSRYIIASPENLHLSYFNLSSMEHLEQRWRVDAAAAFADSFAQKAFERLTVTVQTAVSVAVYDADRVAKYTIAVDSLYRKAFLQKPLPMVRCDCAEEPDFFMPNMGDGVKVYYRAARFGRNKLKNTHSGWECWKHNQAPAP